MTARQMAREVFLLAYWNEMPERDKTETAYRLLQLSIILYAGIIALASLAFDTYGKPWMFLAGIASFAILLVLSYYWTETWIERRELERMEFEVDETLETIFNAA